MAQGHTGNQVYILVENTSSSTTHRCPMCTRGPMTARSPITASAPTCAEESTRAVGETIADGWIPAAGEAPDVNSDVMRAKVARGLVQIRAAVGQAMRRRRLQNDYSRAGCRNSRRLRDSDRYATQLPSAFASVPMRSTSVSGLREAHSQIVQRVPRAKRPCAVPEADRLFTGRLGALDPAPPREPSQAPCRQPASSAMRQNRRGDVDGRRGVDHAIGNDQVEALRLGIGPNCSIRIFCRRDISSLRRALKSS